MIMRFIASIYIFAQPVIGILVAGAPEVYHLKIITAYWSIIHFCILMVMLVLYDPRLCVKNFPFHANVNEMRDNREEDQDLPGFSGGTLAVLDEDGQIRVLNSFDKMHIARLKGEV